MPRDLVWIQANFADVMQLASQLQRIQLSGIEPDQLADAHTNLGNSISMGFFDRMRQEDLVDHLVDHVVPVALTFNHFLFIHGILGRFVSIWNGHSAF